MLCVLSCRQSKDKTALKRSAQRPRASRRGGARVCFPHFFLSLPLLPFSFSLSPLLLLSFPFSESARSLARAYVSRFACRVRGRGSRRTDREKKKTGSREEGGRRRGGGGRPTTLVLLLRGPLHPRPPLGTDFTTFKKRLHNRMYRPS